ncbi:hypothetical protein [Streptomyces sp. NPDC012510]|uniref:hypothetical protein n=1 Tax=Streptomyces sp. NPDC012510 TaxID=3364838 RepID=UPI0036E585D4
MKPITAGLLVAFADGTAGPAGEQVWARLRELVASRQTDGQDTWELAAEAPLSAERARRLADLLNRSAERDPDFAGALAAWRRSVDDVTAPGVAHNTVSGGTQSVVVQGHHFQGDIHYGGPAR